MKTDSEHPGGIDSLKAYRDWKSTIDTAAYKGHEKGLEEGLRKGRKEGRAEGRKEGRKEGRREQAFAIARQMKADQEPLNKIMRYTGLTEAEIDRL